jgi:hypothetical protein
MKRVVSLSLATAVVLFPLAGIGAVSVGYVGALVLRGDPSATEAKPRGGMRYLVHEIDAGRVGERKYGT